MLNPHGMHSLTPLHAFLIALSSFFFSSFCSFSFSLFSYQGRFGRSSGSSTHLKR